MTTATEKSIERDPSCLSRGEQQVLTFLERPSMWPREALTRGSTTYWWGQKSLAVATGWSVSSLKRITEALEKKGRIFAAVRGNRDIYAATARLLDPPGNGSQPPRRGGDHGRGIQNTRTPGAA